MRAVALSDKEIQSEINKNFIPLKLEVKKGAPEFPLDWAALSRWRTVYKFNLPGMEEKQGFTMCTVVTPDLEMELGSTGSAFIWEIFDSIAYDKDRFLTMIKDAHRFALEREKLLAAIGAGERASRFNYLRWKRKVEKRIRANGRVGLPPKGFTAENAKELLRMTGDLK